MALCNYDKTNRKWLSEVIRRVIGIASHVVLTVAYSFSLSQKHLQGWTHSVLPMPQNFVTDTVVISSEMMFFNLLPSYIFTVFLQQVIFIQYFLVSESFFLCFVLLLGYAIVFYFLSLILISFVHGKISCPYRLLFSCLSSSFKFFLPA